jgi:hypothetical protein
MPEFDSGSGGTALDNDANAGSLRIMGALRGNRNPRGTNNSGKYDYDEVRSPPKRAGELGTGSDGGHDLCLKPSRTITKTYGVFDGAERGH